MQRYKYQALVTLSPSEDGGLDAEPPRLVQRQSARACHHETHRSELFSALATAAGGSPLGPGAADMTATILVLGDDVDDYLAPRGAVRPLARPRSRPRRGDPPAVYLTRMHVT